MKNWLTVGRLFYGAGITCLGLQQLYDGAFLSVILPVWPAWMHHPILAYLIAAVLIAAGVFILLNKHTVRIAIGLSVLLFAFFIIFQVPYLLFVGPYSPRHPGLWTDTLKEFALCGGALIVASLFTNKYVRIGSIFFSIMLITFGADHFLYTDTVANMVPRWAGVYVFWAYFAGTALIASGVAIMFKLFLKQAALLCSAMIFIWFIVLHLPATFSQHYTTGNGDVAGSCEALAFSGIALMIGVLAGEKK